MIALDVLARLPPEARAVLLMIQEIGGDIDETKRATNRGLSPSNH